MKKLLVIEDDPDTLTIIRFLFEDKGFNVSESQNKVPIELIIKNNPNLILLDHVLPDGFGKEICKEIKANPHTSHIPVILFSTVTGLEKLANEGSADAYIEKPFDINDLEKMVMKMTL